MTEKDYMDGQIAIIDMGKKTTTLKLDEMLQWINRAETVAPIVDPTMYRKAQSNLKALKGLVEAFLKVRTAHQEFFQAVIGTAAAGHMNMRTGEFTKGRE